MDTMMWRERKQLQRKRVKQISYLPREQYRSCTEHTRGADVVSAPLNRGLPELGEDLLQLRSACAAPHIQPDGADGGRRD
ncbi:hypothetical protein Q5P01_010413 [Channa striata]|uniref:Uncharacterized protein n=1 Tax=Channa striata TaxID=64152 RepID=A0AA88MXW9_CHASR|nr:hypothetical protein Q5P01_010413 [Channa striata]